MNPGSCGFLVQKWACGLAGEMHVFTIGATWLHVMFSAGMQLDSDIKGSGRNVDPS